MAKPEFTQDQVILMIAGLCDAIKRLEQAVTMDDLEDRKAYAAEAAKKRRSVERIVLK